MVNIWLDMCFHVALIAEAVTVGTRARGREKRHPFLHVPDLGVTRYSIPFAKCTIILQKRKTPVKAGQFQNLGFFLEQEVCIVINNHCGTSGPDVSSE